jgi:hypothetical protein
VACSLLDQRRDASGQCGRRSAARFGR